MARGHKETGDEGAGSDVRLALLGITAVFRDGKPM